MLARWRKSYFIMRDKVTVIYKNKLGIKYIDYKITAIKIDVVYKHDKNI